MALSRRDGVLAASVATIDGVSAANIATADGAAWPLADYFYDNFDGANSTLIQNHTPDYDLAANGWTNNNFDRLAISTNRTGGDSSGDLYSNTGDAGETIAEFDIVADGFWRLRMRADCSSYTFQPYQFKLAVNSNEGSTYNDLWGIECYKNDPGTVNCLFRIMEYTNVVGPATARASSDMTSILPNGGTWDSADIGFFKIIAATEGNTIECAVTADDDTFYEHLTYTVASRRNNTLSTGRIWYLPGLTDDLISWFSVDDPTTNSVPTS